MSIFEKKFKKNSEEDGHSGYTGIGGWGVCDLELANTENYYNGLQRPFDSLQNKIKWDFFE